MISIFRTALQDKQSIKTFLLTVVLRSAFLGSFLLILNETIQLGTSPFLMLLTLVGGIIAASLLAFSRLNQRGFLVLCALILLALWLLKNLVEALPVYSSLTVFLPFSLIQHGTTLALIFFAGFLTTWGFWRIQAALSLEILLIGLVAIGTTALHRDYRLDLPKGINNLAWAIGVNQLTAFIALGISTVLLIWIYLVAGNIPGRPHYSTSRKSREIVHKAHRGLFLTAIVIFIGTIILFLVGDQIYRHFNSELLSRIAGGVGQAKDEGLSPLGFHDAIGGSNQPAALVRLEGDYPDNPFSPMLYLREGALSSFNGTEMVIAGRAYDPDVNQTSPFEAYSGQGDPDLIWRTPLTQSIYLLADHQMAFAIDYPLSITPLKNPKPDKFKAAYKAYSMVPAQPMEKLLDTKVGNPKWSELERQHYLKPHPDQRYMEIARQIAEQVDTPIKQAVALSRYLSTHATYTLTPNHAVPTGEDPVAPFLFGDLRGYCVHFAHAMVYMLRSLGIPARIGSGYLTDLSEAKDGHILLRISDRHAWAEVYITNFGWVPFDVTPTKVESHANTEVDLQLLEELMGLLDPDEEILPSTVPQDEKNAFTPPRLKMPSFFTLASLACLTVILLYIFKTYLILSWHLPATPWRRLMRAYRASNIVLAELGITRRTGETRQEFNQRAANILQTDELLLPRIMNITIYAKSGKANLSNQHVFSAVQKDRLLFDQLPKGKRWKVIFGLASILSILTGEFK